MGVMGVYVFEQKKAAYSCESTFVLLVSNRNLVWSRLDGLYCGHSKSGSNPGIAIFSVLFLFETGVRAHAL